MGEAKRKKKKHRGLLVTEARCIYCANTPTTIEHMPPIAMFRTRQRPNGMEFAACKECNNGTRGADTVAAFFARISQDENPAMIVEARALQNNLVKLAPGVLEEFHRPEKTRQRWMRTRRGVLKPMIQVQMDGPLTKIYLQVFAAKFGMALYREHIGEPLPLNGAVQLMFFLNAGLTEQAVLGMLDKLPGHQTLQQGQFRVPEQFAYRYNFDGKTIVAALAGFHSNFHLFVAATSRPDFFEFPQFAEHISTVRPGQLVGMIPRRMLERA
jgi:hypothetical protein